MWERKSCSMLECSLVKVLCLICWSSCPILIKMAELTVKSLVTQNMTAVGSDFVLVLFSSFAILACVR